MSVLSAIRKQKQQGFTLLEVLLVVAIIAILAGIVIIAVNPNRNLGDTRNSQRSADVSTILNAVYQFSLDNNGALPASIPQAPTAAGEICGATSCGTLVNLNDLTADGRYLVALPQDPQCPDACAADGIGYTIQRDANNRVTVAAPDAELGRTITVTR